jgi:hypothetical protein
MSSRFRSGALSGLIVLVGVAFLIAFVAAPAAAYLALWLVAEGRGLRYRSKRDFLEFELDGFDAARLETARDAAADVVQRLSDIEAGRIQVQDPEGETDQLIERYRLLRTQISALRELPLQRLRKWSSARAMISTCRIGLLCIPPLTAGALILLSGAENPLAGDPYRIVSAICAAWIPLAMPLLFLLRRRRIERSLGDRDLFIERWRPDDDFLDFYLARAERNEAEADREAPAEPPPAKESRTEGERPKRPWHVVLGVEPDAADADIRRAYHQRLMEYHPDKTQQLGVEIKALAELVTREITAAYEEAGRQR